MGVGVIESKEKRVFVITNMFYKQDEGVVMLQNGAKKEGMIYYYWMDPPFFQGPPVLG